MNTKTKVKQVESWIRKSSFSGNDLSVLRLRNEYQVSFTYRTTAPRASTILTRIRLVCQGGFDGNDWSANSCCMGKLPEANDQLALWKFTIAVQVHVPKKIPA